MPTPTSSAYSRSARRSSTGTHRSPGEVVGVLDRERRGRHEERPHVRGEHLLDHRQVDAAARVPPGAHGEAGVRRVRAELGAGDVGARLAEHLLAGADQGADGEHVGHRAGRGEQRRLVAEQRRPPAPRARGPWGPRRTRRRRPRRRPSRAASPRWGGSGCRCAGQRSPGHPVSPEVSSRLAASAPRSRGRRWRPEQPGRRGPQALRSISATRNASSRDCTRFSRGSHDRLVAVRRGRSRPAPRRRRRTR